MEGNGRKKQQVRFKINLDELSPAVCPECECPIFHKNASMFKKLKSLQSPTGKAMMIDIPVVTCMGCDNIFVIKDDEFVPCIEKNEDSVA